jgi:hypothetical protein
VGKSRLALEVILKPRGGTWNAGFLDERHAGPDWSAWQPHLSTFMVIDYAASAADKVALLIAALAEREGAHQLQRPVRLLLVERQAEGPWLNRILALSRKGRNCRGADLALGHPAPCGRSFSMSGAGASRAGICRTRRKLCPALPRWIRGGARFLPC